MENNIMKSRHKQVFTETIQTAPCLPEQLTASEWTKDNLQGYYRQHVVSTSSARRTVPTLKEHVVQEL